MNTTNTYGVLMILMLLYGCNNRKTLEKADSVEPSAINHEWLAELALKNPLNSQELMRLLPPKLQGMPLINTEPNGVQAIIGIYSDKGDPDYGSTAITLTLVDGAGDNRFRQVNAIYKLLNQDINQWSDKGWTKTTIHNKHKMLVKEQTMTGNTDIQSTVTSSIDMIKNQRFHINLTGRHVPGNQLIRAFDELTSLSSPE